MKNIENIVNAIHVFFLLSSIIVGVIRFKKLNELKSLFAITILSIIQNLGIIIAPSLHRFNKNEFLKFTNLSVDIYVIFEFILISFFLSKITEYKKGLKTSFLFLLLVILLSTLIQPTTHILNLKYFLIVEGLFIEFFVLHHLLLKIRQNILTNIFSEPVFICSMGIFLSFALIWPSSMLLDLFRNSINKYYIYFGIINYSGYILFFISLTAGFYGKRK